jgi:hypothetical protein
VNELASQDDLNGAWPELWKVVGNPEIIETGFEEITRNVLEADFWLVMVRIPLCAFTLKNKQI